MILLMFALAAIGFAMLIGGAAYNVFKRGQAMTHEEVEAMASSRRNELSVNRIYGTAVGLLCRYQGLAFRARTIRAHLSLERAPVAGSMAERGSLRAPDIPAPLATTGAPR